MPNVYDVLIVGGGVAGMSAGVYAKRSGKKIAIIEKMSLGGTVSTLNKIKNFPSQEEVSGFELAQMFSKQIEGLGVEVVYDDILTAKLGGQVKTLKGKNATYKARRVILATGLTYRELGKNESKFLGKGVSYCAVCDANFFKGEPVCVVSRRGSGIKDAKYLSGIASQVFLLDEGDMSAFVKANAGSNINVVSNVEIQRVLGKNAVEGVEYVENGVKKTAQVKAVFVCLGRVPRVEMFGKELSVDELGFVKTDENMQTSVEGVYAVGDVRAGVLKQIVTACNDGAIAGKKACEGL